MKHTDDLGSLSILDQLPESYYPSCRHNEATGNCEKCGIFLCLDCDDHEFVDGGEGVVNCQNCIDRAKFEAEIVKQIPKMFMVRGGRR